ncbi:MAG: TetR/AcrR family transcriptional regulator [Propionibacteriaceae bacterium]
MTEQPFHHGNLRAVLLERAEEMLRETGVDGLSLRELARRAGVSHGAPRSHFIDRQTLLDALAERGFTRLADDVSAAMAHEQDDLHERLFAVARAYVRFAVSDAALLELMFAAKNADPPDSVLLASERLFTILGGLIETGIAAGLIRGQDGYRTQLLFAATMQGIASLVASRRITADQGDELIVDAIGLLTTPARPLPSPSARGTVDPAG